MLKQVRLKNQHFLYGLFMKIFLKFLTVASLTFLYPVFSNNFLLSKPRSGSHFFIYGVCYLTLEPFTSLPSFFQGHKPHMQNSFVNPFNLNFDNDLHPILIRTHLAHEVKKFRSKEDKLIVIVRNPLESILALKRTQLRIRESDLKHYISYLEFFEKWEPENRLLIYYEDLLTNPRKVFDTTLSFLNKNKNRLNEFIDNIDFYKTLAMKRYSEHFPNYPAQSNFKLEHHQFYLNDLYKSKRYAFEYFSRKYPDIYRKYLSHYFE